MSVGNIRINYCQLYSAESDECLYDNKLVMMGVCKALLDGKKELERKDLTQVSSMIRIEN